MPTAAIASGAATVPMCATTRVRCLSPEQAAAWWPADALLRPAPGVPHTYVGATARGGYGPGEASAANGSALWLILAEREAGPLELSHGRLPAAGAILVQAVLMPPDGSPSPVPPGARTIVVRGRPATVGTGRQAGVEGEIRVVAYDEVGAGRWIYWNVLDSPTRRTEAELVRAVDALTRTSG